MNLHLNKLNFVLISASDVALVQDPEELEVYGKETMQSTSSNVITYSFEVSMRSCSLDLRSYHLEMFKPIVHFMKP